MKMSEIRKQIGVGSTLFAAMKNKMGLSSARFGLLSQFTKFFNENPTFRTKEVYHRKCVPVEKAGK